MDIKDVFARNLRIARNARKMSQEKLADVAGLDRTYISSLERCAYSASITTVQSLANALGVSESDLLKRD